MALNVWRFRSNVALGTVNQNGSHRPIRLNKERGLALVLAFVAETVLGLPPNHILGSLRGDSFAAPDECRLCGNRGSRGNSMDAALPHNSVQAADTHADHRRERNLNCHWVEVGSAGLGANSICSG